MVRILCLNPVIDRMYYIDNFIPGRQYHGNIPEAYASGKGVNIMRIMRGFGLETVLYAFVGGANGKLVESEIERVGSRSVLFHHEGETRTTINIIDHSCRKETEITEAGGKIDTQQQQEFLDCLSSDCQRGDVIICSGLPANGMSPDIYRKVSQIAEARDAYCVIDANRIYLKSSFPGKYLLAKPNKDELSRLFDNGAMYTDDEALVAAKKLIGMGVENVLVSAGENGALFTNGSASYRVHVPNVEVISTIGSGDSTVSGFCYGHLKGCCLEECLSYAMAFGVVNAMHPEVGIVPPQEAEEMKSRITIERIS